YSTTSISNSLHSFLKNPLTTRIYTLSLHDALPICSGPAEPGHDLIEHQEDPVLVAELAQPLQVAVGWHENAGRAGYRLDEDRSRSEEHTSELQSRVDLVCRLLLEKKKDQRRKCCGH